MARVLERVFSDVRYGVRWHWTNRGITGTALAALVVAITATASLFTVADALLLRPLPFPDADRLVFVGPATPTAVVPQRARRSELEKLHSSSILDGAFGYSEVGPSATPGGEHVTQVDVTREMTRVLGVHPIRGRSFDATDVSDTADRAVLISHGLWTSHFGADPAILNEMVMLGDRQVRVIGVMPPRFNFPRGAGVWRLSPPSTTIDIRALVVVARFKADAPVVTRFDADGVTFQTLHLKEGIRPANARSVPLVLVSVGAAVLLVGAWVHLGMLRATQLIDRQRDLAVRLALGARRSTLYQVVIVESLIFVGLGALLSLLLLPMVVSQVTTLVAASDTNGLAILVDYRTVVFLGIATFLGAAVTSIGPIRLITRLPVLTALHAGATPSLRSGPWGRASALTLQIVVVAASVYVSLALIQHVRRLGATDLGFDPTGVLAIDSSASTIRNPLAGESELFDRLRAIPGVMAVAVGLRPLSSSLGRPEFVSADQLPRPAGAPRFNAHVVSISPGYFAALRTPIVQGRDFERDDDPRAVILSESLARSISPDGNVLETGVHLGSGPNRFPVVGIARDIFSGAPSVQALSAIYLNQRGSSLIVRVDPAQAPAVATALAGLMAAPGVPASQIRVHRVQDAFDKFLEPERTRAGVVGLQSSAALLLSVLGVYVTATSALRQQLRHAAIRRALGGSAYQLLTWFSRDLVVSGIVGSLCGVVVGSLGLRLLLPAATQSPLDLPASAFTVVIVMGCCAIAALRPAYSITRVNPAVVLRNL